MPITDHMSSAGPESRAEKLSSLRKRLERIGDLVARTCLVVAAIGLFIIVGINGANVVSRYFFGMAWSWAEEAMLFLLVLAVFAGAVTATWRGAHMQLEMLLERLPPRWQRVAIIFAAFSGVAVLGVLSASSFQVVSLLYRFGQKSTALEFPMWIPQGCVSAGFVLIAMMMLLRLAAFGARMSTSEFRGLAE
jgi:TRAP-type C4-dicarboxylate transport system permease small subunit